MAVSTISHFEGQTVSSDHALPQNAVAEDSPVTVCAHVFSV